MKLSWRYCGTCSTINEAPAPNLDTHKRKQCVGRIATPGVIVSNQSLDGLRVAGPTLLQRATLDSFGDHRIAMAFTVAALLADGTSEIAGADCVAISFPEFFDLLESVTDHS